MKLPTVNNLIPFMLHIAHVLCSILQTMCFAGFAAGVHGLAETRKFVIASGNTAVLVS